MSNKDQEITDSAGGSTPEITPDNEGSGTTEGQGKSTDRPSRGGPKTEPGKRRSSANALRHGVLSVRPVVTGMEDAQLWEDHRASIFSSTSPVNELEAALTERIAIQLWRLGRVVRYETSAIQSNQSLAKLGLLPAERPGFSSTDLEEATASVEHAEAVVGLVRHFDKLGDDEAMERNAAVAFLWLAYKAAFVHRDVEVSVPGIPDEDDEFDAFDRWTPGLLRRACAAYSAKVGISPESLSNRMTERASEDCARARATVQSAKRAKEQALLENTLPPQDVLDKVIRYETTLERSLIRTLHELQRLQGSRAGLCGPPGALTSESLQFRRLGNSSFGKDDTDRALAAQQIGRYGRTTAVIPAGFSPLHFEPPLRRSLPLSGERDAEPLNCEGGFAFRTAPLARHVGEGPRLRGRSRAGAGLDGGAGVIGD